MSPTKLFILSGIVCLWLASPVAANEAVSTEAVDAANEVAAQVSDVVDALAQDASDAANDVSEGVAEVPAALDPAESNEVTESTPPSGESVPLGAVGYDSDGRQGRIHLVAKGDTLWAISDAYLGTSWVWPSIWNDNGDIENPHLIYPGDRIWITPNEMRKLTAAEADAMLANSPAPAAMEDEFFEPAPAPRVVNAPTDFGSVRVTGRETVGLITEEKLEASASIVGRIPERVLLSQEDHVYVGLGEADVDPGDQFTAFRTHEKVFDPDSGALLGYHVEFVGWVEVEETYPETSKARIGMSTGEIEEGDRLIPREELSEEVTLQPSPADVEGKISFFPKKRVLMGFADFVYLNRGTLDGLDVGVPLEVYRPGYHADETARDENVHVPDRVVAQLLVVRADTQSAVALIRTSDTELALGDRFRGETP